MKHGFDAPVDQRTCLRTIPSTAYQIPVQESTEKDNNEYKSLLTGEKKDDGQRKCSG